MLTVTKNVINIYAKPDILSEVTSQALLGAHLSEQEKTRDFVHVICEDMYSGWVSARFLVEDEAYVAATKISDCPVVIDLFANVYSTPDTNAELVSRLVLSSKICTVSVPNMAGQVEPAADKFSDLVKVHLPGGASGWVKQSSIARLPAIANTSNWGESSEQHEVLIKMLGERVVTTAKRLIGVPYLWGGCTPFGIDCSGLVQLCYKMEDVQLLRDTYLQSGDKRFVETERGVPFNKAHFKAGDLVVFGTENNRGTGDHNMHIGIACGDGRFIHSSGRERNFGVYIDSCSEPFYVDRYMKALRLSSSDELSIEKA